MATLEELREHLAAGDVAVVAGAGVSLAATRNNPLAGWSGLLRSGLQFCADHAQEHLDPNELELALKLVDVGRTEFLVAAAEIITARLDAPTGPEWKGWLAGSVGKLRAIDTELVEAIRNLNAPILTTNYDSILIRASEDAEREHMTWEKAENWVDVLNGSSKAVIYLHGFWREEKSVILGARSYERLVADEPTQQILRSFGRQKNFLFVGYGTGINDPNFGPLIDWLGRSGRHHSSQHFILLTDEEADEFQNRPGLEAIGFGPTKDFLPGFLRDLVKAKLAGRVSIDHDVASVLADFEEFQEVDDVLVPRMVVMPSGEFEMGSRWNSGEPAGQDDQLPLHRVTIDYRFAVSAAPVTFAEWDAFQLQIGGMRALYAKDGGWGRGSRPAVNVSWDDIQIYLDWLNNLEPVTGFYRLLSEAEWEYVARAGTETKYWWGDSSDSSKANFDESDIKRTNEVRLYPPNPFQLFDTLGNVWEWVQDRYHPTFEEAPTDGSVWEDGDDHRRVVRGGSWYYDAQFLECSARLGIGPGVRFNGIGFRIARTIRQTLRVDQPYGIVSVSSGKAVTVDEGKGSVSQRRWRQLKGQIWRLRESDEGPNGPFILEAEGDGRVLSIAEPYDRNYARVVIEPRNEAARCLWIPHPERDGWVWENVQSRRVLDVEGISNAEGGDIIQFARHGNENQRWWLRPVRTPT